MYVFTLFGYYMLKDSYPEKFCDSTWICLITAVDRSFKSDGIFLKCFIYIYIFSFIIGGLGGFMGYPDDKKDDNTYFLIRFFFDNIYFILLMIIMINIVAGIFFLYTYI